jgi:hypothetical protein
MAFRTSGVYAPGGARDMETKQGMILEITHVPTDETVTFPAFIDMLSDAFNSNWQAEEVYGRMDPIATFINTRRAISVSWHVPADSFDHAQENLVKANRLFSFLYPLYDDKGTAGATAINQGPLWRVKFGNLIRDSKTGNGLLGYVNGLTFDPTFDNGVFYSKPSKVAKEEKTLVRGMENMNTEYLPKTFRLNFEFTVLHEHSLGYKKATGKKKFEFRDKYINNQNYPWATTGNAKLNKETEARSKKNRGTLKEIQHMMRPSGGNGDPVSLSNLKTSLEKELEDPESVTSTMMKGGN